jgi:23S rRNA pseudouridine1911/1915/1917 synthase
MAKDLENQDEDYKPIEEGDLRQYVVPSALSGLRLDQALAQLLPEHSRSRMQGWIESGKVAVDGTPQTSCKHKVWGGERLVVGIEADPTTTPDVAEAIPLDIVFEDPALLILNKPAGLVVHPGSGNPRGTLLNALLHHLPRAAEIPRAGIVHRLDKDTTGLMVVAKTLQAQTDLVRQLHARTVKREYLAVAYGELDRAGTVDAPLARDPHNRIKRSVQPLGKPAVTHYEIIERFPGVTFVRCKLETGRTHQIRVHMQHIGCPLVGDPVYSAGRRGRARMPFPRQALHAERLGLIHPVLHEPMQWEIAQPADFASLLAALRAGADWDERWLADDDGDDLA